jgi:hypothetical protein
MSKEHMRAMTIRANRRNGSRSTGPRSCSGKAIAARNAHRRGLTLPPSSPQEIDKTNPTEKRQ